MEREDEVKTGCRGGHGLPRAVVPNGRKERRKEGISTVERVVR
jgi:hypothetical protein